MDGFEGEIGGETKGESAREDEAVAGVEVDRFGQAFDDDPAVAGEHGVTLDALVAGEGDGQVAGDVEAAAGQALGLHEG